MASQTFIIFAGDASWRMGTVRAGKVTIREVGSIEGVAAAVREEGYRGEGVLLALPSAWCIAAKVETPDLARHERDRKAMLYRLEEKLPLAAEQIVADFVAAGEGQSALGICVRVDRVGPIVEALEAAGVAIQSVTPAAFLAAQSLCGDGAQLLLLGEAGQVNVIAIERRRPMSWGLVPESIEDVRLELAVAGMKLGEGVTAHGLDVDAELLAAAGAAPIQGAGSMEAHAVMAGAEALRGWPGLWIELRRDALAPADSLRFVRPALDAALVAAAVFLLALAGGMLVRGQKYGAVAAEYEQKTGQAFRRQYPDWPTPANVRAVLESERKKMGERGQGSGGSALRVLEGVLAKLPRDVKYRFERMDFAGESFELEGKAKSFEDVDKLVAAARQAGLEVALPEKRRDEAGLWAFTIRAQAPGGKPTPLAARGDVP